jgi:hypothetical protein
MRNASPYTEEGRESDKSVLAISCQAKSWKRIAVRRECCKDDTHDRKYLSQTKGPFVRFWQDHAATAFGAEYCGINPGVFGKIGDKETPSGRQHVRAGGYNWRCDVA